MGKQTHIVNNQDYIFEFFPCCMPSFCTVLVFLSLVHDVDVNGNTEAEVEVGNNSVDYFIFR
jgi:hypothetical protein